MPFHVQIYRKPALIGPQKWQWRAVANGNNERLARGESYRHKQDMLETVWDLFGTAVTIKQVAR